MTFVCLCRTAFGLFGFFYAKGQALGDLFLDLVLEACPEIKIGCPRNADERGSQVTLKHRGGYAIIQAMIAKGVVGDFRSPDVMRFGFTPLYVTPDDVMAAVDALHRILDNRLWDNPKFMIKNKVT